MTRIMVFLAVVGALSASAVELNPIAGDATEMLQKAFDDPANDEVVLKAGNWVTRPLRVNRSNWTLRLKDGAHVIAKKGEYHGQNDEVLNVSDIKNFALLGEGNASFEMDLRAYQDKSRYSFSEWRHTYISYGGENLTIRGISFIRSGGDGIAIHGTKNMIVEDCKLIDCNRLGMGVVECDGLVIRRCQFVANNGTAPCGGIDFEPNNSREGICGVLMEDCIFAGHRASGLLMHLPTQDGTSKPVSAIIRRCISVNSGLDGFRVTATGDKGPVKGYVKFIDCKSFNAKNNDLTLLQVAKDGIRFDVVDCEFPKREITEWTKPEGCETWNARALEVLVPESGLRSTGWYRGDLKFVQLAPSAGDYEVRFFSKNFPADKMKIKIFVTDMSGTPLETLNFGETGFGPNGYAYKFSVNNRNCRQFFIEAHGGLIKVESNHPGALIRADDLAHPYMFDSNRVYAFKVPAAAVEAKLQLRAEEPIAAVLLDAKGKEVASCRASAPGKRETLRAKRAQTAADEVWRVRFTEQKEDGYFSVASPSPCYVELVPVK